MFSNPFITSTLEQNQQSAFQVSGAVLHTPELEGSGHTLLQGVLKSGNDQQQTINTPNQPPLIFNSQLHSQFFPTLKCHSMLTPLLILPSSHSSFANTPILLLARTHQPLEVTLNTPTELVVGKINFGTIPILESAY